MRWLNRLVVSRKHEKAIKAAVAARLLVGDGLMQVQIVKGAGKSETERFYRCLCSKTHHFVFMETSSPSSSCSTIRRGMQDLRGSWGPEVNPSRVAGP